MRNFQDTFEIRKLSFIIAFASCMTVPLSFLLPPKQLSYSDYLINFELFYRSIDDLKILSRDNLDFIKTRIKDTALTSFRNYNANLVIQKADKDNSVVKFEKDVYVRHMETILSDLVKFEKVSIKKGILNFSINDEKTLTIIW